MEKITWNGCHEIDLRVQKWIMYGDHPLFSMRKSYLQFVSSYNEDKCIHKFIYGLSFFIKKNAMSGSKSAFTLYPMTKASKK